MSWQHEVPVGRGGRARGRCRAGLVLATLVSCGACVDTSEVAGLYPGVGSRVGGLFVIASGTDYEPSLVIGQYYAATLPGVFGLKSLPVEVGLDMGYAKSDDGSESWAMYQPFVDVLLSNWPADKPSFYGVVGFRILFLDRAGPDPISDIGSSIDVGVGVTSLGGRWDARLGYAIVLGSGSINGLLALTGAIRF